MRFDAEKSRDQWRLLLGQLAELTWGPARAAEIETQLSQMAGSLARISARAPLPETVPGRLRD
jgi:hypothetical protein